MTGGSLGLRTGSYGSLQQGHNGAYPISSFGGRKPSKLSLSGREKERALPCMYKCLSRRKVGMMILVAFALLVFMTGFLTVNKEDASESTGSGILQMVQDIGPYFHVLEDGPRDNSSFIMNRVTVCGENKNELLPSHPPSAAKVTGSVVSNRCKNFAFSPPPPADRRRGPRPCPVCYLPVEEAIASMPNSPSVSPLVQHLNYIREENPVKIEPYGGSGFGGYPSLDQRNDSFNLRESMTLHCGFVKGCRPGHGTGFDIDEADLRELAQFHDVIVASAIFGNYDVIQQPEDVSDIARKQVPFFMFIDEETEAYMKNSSVLDSTKRAGIWRVIVVYNIPYTDARRNGKVPKLLLHRLFPNVRYSIWIDGKLQLVADPYQVLERFLWRDNATFAISKHYRRFDVFEEAEANKAAGKYDNASIDRQINFYKKEEGLTPYSEAKLPITSDVPEGCAIIREHIPITNLFTCLWFNEVDRFTSRDQLSFSTVRDRLMAQVDWSIDMFMDCERRNFVVQAYHRDLLEQMPPPPPPGLVVHHSPPLSSALMTEKEKEREKEKENTGVIISSRENPAGGRTIPTPVIKKIPVKKGKGDRKSGSKRHRKVGGRENF